MNLNIYSIYDSVAGTFTTPIFLHNDNEAKRLFKTWCNNPELPMHANPGDYALYAIGFYDNNSGLIEPQTPHNQIMKGSSSEPHLTAVGED